MKKINKFQFSQLEFVISRIDISTLLLDRAKKTILSIAIELIEQDIKKLCGDPFEKKSKGRCRRGGSRYTSLIVDGAKINFS